MNEAHLAAAQRYISLSPVARVAVQARGTGAGRIRTRI
jgi:hypothetical protein